MLEFGCRKKLPRFVQIHQDILVGILHEFARIRGLLSHLSLSVYKLHKGKIIFASHLGIVLTEGRGNVHDTRTVRHGDVAVAGHEMSLFFLLCRRFPGAGKQRLIFPVFQILPGKGLQNLIGCLSFLRQRTQNLLKQSLRHIIGIAVRRLHLHIGLLRIHAQRHIGGQSPGRGGPCQEISVLANRLEAHNGGALLHRLIALRHLMRGERGPASGAVGHDLEPLVQKALIPDLLERPPFRLDEIVVIGHVGLVHVGPESDRAGEVLPHTLIFPDALLALADKGIQSVLLDLLLPVQPKELFHLQLHRQPVRVPARLSGNHIALHGAVSGNHVLDHTGQHMSDMGHAVSRGRPVIKGVGRPLLSVFHTLFKDVSLFPEGLDLFFSGHKIQIR